MNCFTRPHSIGLRAVVPYGYCEGCLWIFVTDSVVPASENEAVLVEIVPLLLSFEASQLHRANARQFYENSLTSHHCSIGC